METSEFIFDAGDGQKIHVYSWIPGQPIAVLQVVHGMMEHAARYDHFARWMAEHGIAVYASDHRGHGRSADQGLDPRHCLGYFAARKGWDLVVNDLFSLSTIIRKKHPGMRLFLLGHSVGSALARTFIAKHGDHLGGVILSGPLQQPSMMLLAGTGLAEGLKLIKGPFHRSVILKNAGYGSYSRHFRPSRTDFDWLTHREDIVDAYISDRLSGFPSTTSYYSDLFRGMLFNNRAKNLAAIPKDLPVHIMAGNRDPAGNFGKSPVRVQRQLMGAGMINVSLKIYPGGRHEMLNETNREEVYTDLHEWIRKEI